MRVRARVRACRRTLACGLRARTTNVHVDNGCRYHLIFTAEKRKEGESVVGAPALCRAASCLVPVSYFVAWQLLLQPLLPPPLLPPLLSYPSSLRRPRNRAALGPSDPTSQCTLPFFSLDTLRLMLPFLCASICGFQTRK